MKSRSSVAKKAGLLGVWALALAALAAQVSLVQVIMMRTSDVISRLPEAAAVGGPLETRRHRPTIARSPARSPCFPSRSFPPQLTLPQHTHPRLAAHPLPENKNNPKTALAQQPTAAPAANKNAATVFVNGEILTMAGDGKQPQYVSAVAVKDGRVIYAGDRAGALRAAGMGAAIKDLAGRFMMPGFIDSHAHAILYAHGTLNANLRGVKSVAELQQRLREQAKRVPPGGWIEGMG